MMSPSLLRLSLVIALAPVAWANALKDDAPKTRLVAYPSQIELRGGETEHGLLLSAIDSNGNALDVTGRAVFSSSAPEIVFVDAGGHCKALSDGEARIVAEVDGAKIEIPVMAADLAQKHDPSFKQDVLPILTKAGCNAGGCHGKLTGQNGFRLSLRGYAPEWDYDWLTNEVNARRINLAFPDQSLLVQKPAGLVAHEGGTKFRANSRSYRMLLDWIGARAPGPIETETDAVRLEVLPGDGRLKPGQSQHLLVRAFYADGRVRDVTWLTQFFSNDEGTLSVKQDGLVKALRCGESSVRVHFQGQVQVITFTMPFETAVEDSQFVARQNALDEPLFARLKALHIPPSPPADDARFLRRAFLDTLGTLPTSEEIEAFLADPRPDKRSRLIGSLFERPEFVDFWTLQLADLLQNRKERDHDVRGTKGVRAFHSWLRGEVAVNRPWNEIARAVLLASGPIESNPAIGYFLTVIGEKTKVEESELPDSVAQSFLGTRIGCARCHNHPLEKYTQDDFYRFSAFFSKINLKRSDPWKGGSALSTSSREEDEQQKRVGETELRLADAREMAAALGEEAGGEEAKKKVGEAGAALKENTKRLAELQARVPGVTQPRTNKRMTPLPLDRSELVLAPGHDPREAFVEWMLASENFSGAMVNRLWKHFFKVGLVEPVDDLRASNPPSNRELWAVLNREFSGSGFDLRHIMRLILESRAYQLDSSTLAGNEVDSKFFSHYYARRLPAEVLADALASATGVAAAFPGYPLGTRAIQLPDPSVASYLLTLFGRSERVTACACERSGEVTLPQLLHLHNSEDLLKSIQSKDGRLYSMARHETDDAALVDALTLLTTGRHAREKETLSALNALGTAEREPVLEDFFWALLNSKDFTFNQ